VILTSCVVSSEDEDFSVLLEALQGIYDQQHGGLFVLISVWLLFVIGSLFLSAVCLLFVLITVCLLFSTEYDGFISGGEALPSLVCVITGESAAHG